MIALIGFIMIAMIVFLLLKGKMSPIVVLTLIPVIAALLLGYDPVEIAGFIKDGIGTTTSNGILFIFSVIYFGVMPDTGMFDVIVDFLVKKAGNNVIAVTVATAIIATIAHLDGTTATTVLITIPALYPVYKAMKIDSKILLCLTGACMGVMNLLPWGGLVARAATVLQMDAGDLWHILIPIQIAYYDGCVYVDLDTVECTVALPMHPSNTVTIAELKANTKDILHDCEVKANAQITGAKLDLVR